MLAAASEPGVLKIGRRYDVVTKGGLAREELGWLDPLRGIQRAPNT